MRDRPHMPDPDVLLCERCGYVLDGLAESAVCPECGKSVESSLPGARPGSAWQRGPGVRGWLVTCQELMGTPKRLFERIDEKPPWRLLVTNLVFSALIFTTAAFLQSVFSRRTFPAFEFLPQIVITAVGAGLLAAAVFGGLTCIEVIGVRFWSHRLGRRLPTRVTWAICAHASYAWLVAAALSGAGWALSPALHYQISSLNYQWITPVTALGLLVVSGALLGMVLFETLVYTGVRRCRFINIRPVPAQSAPAQASLTESPEVARTDSDPASPSGQEH